MEMVEFADIRNIRKMSLCFVFKWFMTNSLWIHIIYLVLLQVVSLALKES